MIRRTFYKPDVLCSAEGCTVPIGPGKLFCKGHYFSLPKALMDAWRTAMDARKNMLPRVEQSRLNALYQVAFQNCCEHLRTARPTTADAMTTVAYDARDYADKVISGGAPTEFRYVDGRML